MTGTDHRVARACVFTLTLSLIASAITPGIPRADPGPPDAGREGAAARPAEARVDGETATLVLKPADEPEADEITGALIMRLVSEAKAGDAVGLESEENDEAPPELAARLKSHAVQQALKLRGSRYRYGGTSRGGFDCSGFTRYVYARLGVSLPHSSSAQFRCGTAVPRAQLKPGDLVFFGRGRRYVGHVGIYVGENRFVHASNPSRGVVVDSLGGAYYARTYRGARRIRVKK
ncbi:MAG: C40 family peptidase [Armatimonadetes bacterium]|nr:C40 family peptidase [Armatimonadota bacterium]